jgi:hypothetical protein
LSNSYIGFIVVKPLQKKFVGRTCLKTYPDEDGRRNFPILRKYTANLFGLELHVESLAYQEQDSVVAACATSALWSCFQGTGMLFQHEIPSPVEITKMAGNHLPEDLLAASSRAFPNSGLTATQMAHAVRSVGLDPLVIGTKSRYAVNSALYAYMRGKIPSVLALRMNWQNGQKGKHAIAATGYSIGCKNAVPGEEGVLLRANRIDRIYAHDDQVGPFARMLWRDAETSILETSWGCECVITPEFLLFPLYHKIRIPFRLIEGAITALDLYLEPYRQQVKGLNRAEWDIFLTTVNDYKTGVRIDYECWGDEEILQALSANLPRYIWRVMLRVGEELQFDFLFDATGIAQHNLLVHMSAGKSEKTNYWSVFALAVVANKSTLYSNLPEQAKNILAQFSSP